MSITESDIERILIGYDGVVVDGRSTDQLIIYSLKDEVVGLVKTKSQPLYIELRCDYNLAKQLQEYESVMPANILNKRRFVSILLTGQLDESDIKDQLRHAYEQTKQLVESKQTNQ